MKRPFLVFIKNRRSSEFKYSREVTAIGRCKNSYRVTFASGKSYFYKLDRVKTYSLRSSEKGVRIYRKGRLLKDYDTVDYYTPYLVFRAKGRKSYPVKNDSSIEICKVKEDTTRAKAVIGYYQGILRQNEKPGQIGTLILQDALNDIDLLETRSVLSSYLDGAAPKNRLVEPPLIYPFGCNESQKLAVESSMKSNITVIEGPPGTGKTQTILNLLANLMDQGKTVAVVSNNNAAVFNIREKLERYGYGEVVATLGNNSNRTSFFAGQKEPVNRRTARLSSRKLAKARKNVKLLNSLLTLSFQHQNELAQLQAKLADAEVEFLHLQKEQPFNRHLKLALDRKFRLLRSPKKALQLMNLLERIDFEKELSVGKRIQLLLQFGLSDKTLLKRYREQLHVYANHKFYELYLSKIEKRKAYLNRWLAVNRGERNLKRLVDESKKILEAQLYKRYKQLDTSLFTMQDYKRRFDEFVVRYPVVLSSTLSLHTSIPRGFLFDYLIIDEASQVDSIQSAVCFSCARNAVVVGDSMQLTHIVEKESEERANQLLQENEIEGAYNYAKHNILSSLKALYGDKLPTILLREHYRCHPSIIGFCNKKYYSDKLSIMTQGEGNPFRVIETQIGGERLNANQRQVDETDLYIRENYAKDFEQVGVIAPYRNHANLLQEHLPEEVEADTIHKFQGREKEVIIFNTVKSEIVPFMDDPNLINVAVSRAVKEFVLVKPKSMKLPHGSNLGDLIRYIGYTTNWKDTVVEGKICSVFDLLYKEYNSSFQAFLSTNKRIEGSPAEVIMHKLLTDRVVKENPAFSSVSFVREYRLRDLILDFSLFTEEEIRFMLNNSRLDFLLYSKIDKSPLLAIEVDGVSFHESDLQQERDRKKNRILEKIGLPLLRLATNGHNEEAQIVEHLTVAMDRAAS